MRSKSLIGYGFAFAASLALAGSFIFSKSALNSIDMVMFGFTWFGTGSLLNLVWLFFKKRKSGKLKTGKGIIRLAFLIAVLEGLATVSFYFAIQKMENPAVVSFIGNLGPVLVTLMGIFILGERYSKRQIIGILLSLTGVFAITFQPGAEFHLFIQPGSQYVLLASFLFALATVIARGKNELLDPELMSTIRSFLLFAVFAGLIIISGRSVNLSVSVWSDILIGSFLETLLTIVFAYQALRYIEAAKTSLVISTKAVWLILGAYLFLDTFPGNLELIGGFFSLLGIALITLKASQRSSRT